MGEFCDLLYLHTPFGASDHNGIEWQRTCPPGSPDPDRERYPYPLHPAPGGLLVWGTTMDADRLCWLTGGEPEDWPVVVWSSEGWYETHRTGTAGFIEGWTCGRVDSGLLGVMKPDLAPWFNTFRPRVDRCLLLSEGPSPTPSAWGSCARHWLPPPTGAGGDRTMTRRGRTTSRRSTPTGCSPTTRPAPIGSG